jgi:hypothetical protein
MVDLGYEGHRLDAEGTQPMLMPLPGQIDKTMDVVWIHPSDARYEQVRAWTTKRPAA